MQTIMSICKTHFLAKHNVPEMQNPNRTNFTATKTLEESSMKVPGDTTTP